MDDADLVATAPGDAPAGDAAFAPAARYRLIERLGEGGMGTVWAAHDTALDRVVALKVLHDRFLGAADQARLFAEARAMARLSHRNVVGVYDVAEANGRTYLTMELVRGIDLARWLAAPRAWPEIVALFRDVARGLAAAHAAGVVHRDVKPSNILVGDDGTVRVADFGVAHASVAAPDPGAPASAITAGRIGTLAYMAPEQLHGRPADARSDQFAFCAALFEALHGERPFAAGTVAEQLLAIARGCPPPRRRVPAWLHAIVARGLAADPAARFPTMDRLADALARPRRRARVAIVAGLAVAAIAAVVGVVVARAPAAPTCPDARATLAGAWDAARTDRVRAAFAALPSYGAEAGAAFVAELDRFAAAWVAAADAACRADDAPRGACLATQRDALAALASRAIATADDELAVELPELGDCPPTVVTPRGDARRRTLALAAQAEAARTAGDLARARALLEDALRGQGETRWTTPLHAALARADLATGHLDEAVVESKLVVDRTRVRGERHPAYGRAVLLAGQVLLQTGRVDKARAKATTALRIARDAFGEDHPDVAAARALLDAVPR